MIAPRTHGTTWIAIPAFATLFALLFQYRILSLLKRMGLDVTPIGTRLPITLDFQSSPAWLHPVYYTVDYISAIWFTTVLGIFIAGALVSLTPGLVRAAMQAGGWKEHLAGTLFGVPNMLCTCCAVSAVAGLRSAGAGLLSSLAFFVAAPSLNIVAILLAFQLLPLKLAVARTILGLVATFGVTYVVVRLSPRLHTETVGPDPVSPSETTLFGLVTSWLGHTWKITKSVVPLLLLGFVLVGVFRTVLPFEAVAKHFGDGLWPTLLASLVGTTLMVPTFTEVLWVQELTKHGMATGPAVALLITLPAVSFPSLWVLGRVLRSYKLAAYLGVAILVLGILGGIAFGGLR